MLDSLEILTLVENSAPMRGPFVAEHGLSFLLTARRGDRTVRGLLDVGKSPEVLEHNMKGLGVAPEDIDFLVLSHCHYDHTGGIARFVASTGKENFPVVAHPALFRPHFRADPVLTSIGIQTGDERESVEAAGGKFFLSSDPFPLTPGLVSLGEIPRNTDFEGPGGSFLTLDEGKAVSDPMPDDTGVAALVKGRGAVLVSGCSHSGIVNMIKRVGDLYPGEPLDGVIGGFHLTGAPEDRMKKTIQGIRDGAPRWVAAGHCTGFPMMCRLAEAFEDRFRPLSVGVKIVVEAP